MRLFANLLRLSLPLVFLGCGCAREDGGVAGTPTEAASRLQTAFATAPGEYQRAAEEAAQALRHEDLPAAVESLAALRSSGKVTLEQGLAVHASLVMIESRLLAEAEAGNVRAREAYDRLKRLKQK